MGNHDRDVPEEMFEGITDLAKISIKIKDNELKTFILSHRPILCWEGSNDGSIMLYGHVHTCTNPEVEETTDSELIKFMPKNSWDVGVDNNNYKPISIEEVLEQIENKIKNE